MSSQWVWNGTAWIRMSEPTFNTLEEERKLCIKGLQRIKCMTLEAAEIVCKHHKDLIEQSSKDELFRFQVLDLLEEAECERLEVKKLPDDYYSHLFFDDEEDGESTNGNDNDF